MEEEMPQQKRAAYNSSHDGSLELCSVSNLAELKRGIQAVSEATTVFTSGPVDFTTKKNTANLNFWQQAARLTFSSLLTIKAAQHKWNLDMYAKWAKDL